MNRTRRKLFCGLALLGFLATVPALAQPAPPDPPRGIEERIRARFTSMLRNELSLSDEQAKVVLPAMSKLEERKREIVGERRDLVRGLQSGLREGAPDRELQDLLDRLDHIEDDLRAAERSAMTEIDKELNTRQRVKLRFFVQQFRRQIADRLTDRADRLERRRLRGEGPRRSEPR